MIKMLFTDLEMCGLDWRKYGLHQISCIYCEDGVKKDEFDIHVRPNPNKEISDDALAVSGVTREQVLAYPPMEEVHEWFCNRLGRYVNKYDKKDKMFFAGYNVASFDMPYLRSWFEDCGDKYFGSWFWSVPIDVMILAQQHLMENRPDMVDFKQGTVANYLGIPIEEEKLHDALYDIQVCKEIYERIRDPRRNEQTTLF